MLVVGLMFLKLVKCLLSHATIKMIKNNALNILTVFEVTVSRSHCQTFFKGTADYVHFNSENRQWHINYLKSALKPTFLTSNKQDPAVKIPTGA